MGARRGAMAFEDTLPHIPGYRRLESAGQMGMLLVRATRAALTPPYTWGGELLEQCSITSRRCTGPLAISLFFFAIGGAITLIAGVLVVLGAVDHAGAGQMVGWPRETGYWVTAMVFAGVVGSAMTADIGARKIRDELDAMTVLGVDTLRTLIVPRILALVIMAPILGLVGLFVGLSVQTVALPRLVANSRFDDILASQFATANLIDLWSFLLRLALTGLFVGVVCCAKGLTTKGGAEGVGRAVNEAVFITFLGIWLLNCLWNAAFLPNFPDVTVIRG